MFFIYSALLSQLNLYSVDYYLNYNLYRQKKLKIDLEDEILKKVYKNSKREYKIIDGVNTRVKEYEKK